MKWKYLQYVAVIGAVFGAGCVFPVEDEPRDLRGRATADRGEITFIPSSSNGTLRIIDGDTLVLDGQRIRLHGIDAPELKQTCELPNGKVWACGAWSKTVLMELAAGELRCTVIDVDRYGRSVAQCKTQDGDLGAMMVRQGAAFAYVKYSRDYLPEQRLARAEVAGVWGSRFEAPADHRVAKNAADNAQNASKQANVSQRCTIKGNISKSGYIYHVSGMRWYNKTNVNEQVGERWFCSEAEARAAGWRRAK